jgi:hypothetical protein
LARTAPNVFTIPRAATAGGVGPTPDAGTVTARWPPPRGSSAR